MMRTSACLISGYRREAAEDCALVGYYGASSGNFVGTIYRPHLQRSRIQKDPWRWDRWVFPKRGLGITSTRCVMTQKSAVLRTSV